MVETTWDLHRGVNGLFTFHYMLVPAQNSYGSVFCAVRIASMEELAPSAVPAAVLHNKEKEAPPPAAVVAAIKAVLAKVPEEPDKVLPYSSKVHETIDMLVESHDDTPEPAAAAVAVAAVTGEGSRDAGGQEAPAPVAGGGGAGRGTSLGKRGAGNSTALPEVTEGKAGRGGRGRGTGSAGAAGRRRRQV